MKRESSRATTVRPKRRQALVVVAVSLVPILALTLVVSHFLAVPAKASGSLSFAAAVNYPVGSAPNAVAVGDLNGDGHPDLVTANQSSNTVSVLLGSSNGTLGLANSYSVAALCPSGSGACPVSVAMGDLNGDGHPDLVTANQGSNTVSVLLNNGNGALTLSNSYMVATACPSAVACPVSVAIGDLNGDGHPDLVTANGGSGDVSVLLGNGAGAFAPAVTYGVGGSTVSVAIGDVNGDGKPDLVTAKQINNTVSVLLGKGDGTFAPAATYGVGAAPLSMAIGDLNGDGKPDVVTAGGGFLSVLLNNGNGVFAPDVNYSPAGVGPDTVAISDLNGDGKPDLVTASQTSNLMLVLLGNGDGTFAPAVWFAAGTGPVAVAIGDLNGDSKPDVMTANQGSNDVSVLLNTTVANTPTPTPTAGGGGSNSAQVTVALTGGGLSASTTAAPSLSATLTGRDQTLNYALPITVTDATSSGIGWNLTITSTQFSASSVNTLPTTASTVVSANSVCAAGTCVNPTNAVSYPLTIPAGASAPTPVKLFNAAVGTGLGAFTITPSVNILIPGSTVAGTYTSTITLAIVSGP